MESFMLRAWLIAFKKQSNSICYAHDIICNHLKNDALLESAAVNQKKAINLWITGRPDNRQVQFVELDNYIFARLNRKPVSIQYKEINREFALNDKIEIVINFPAMLEKRKTKDYSSGKQIVLPKKYLNEEEKYEYACRKLSENGMLVKNLKVTNSKRFIHFTKNNTQISLLSYEVVATVEITDLDKFKSAVLNGIGRRKTWGFGMLRFPEFLGDEQDV